MDSTAIVSSSNYSEFSRNVIRCSNTKSEKNTETR